MSIKSINSLKAIVLVVFLVTTLGACKSTQTTAFKHDSLVFIEQNLPKFNASLFDIKEVVAFEQVTGLNEAQKAAFLKFYNDPKFAQTPSHTRVATYLGLLLDQFTYSNKTHTAQKTLDEVTGNCLSLTLLSTALAELVDVDIHFQLLEENPVYSINNNLLVTSDHLRAVLKSSPELLEGDAISRVSYIRIDYFDTDGLSFVDKVSINTQKSLFYSNLAIEYLADNAIDMAYSYAKKALDVYPYNASALNTIGILHSKRGDIKLAEEIYEFGARYYAKAPLFVRNYKRLLVSQGREVDLNKLIDANKQSIHSHPWEWVRAGKVAFNNNDFNEAVMYYQKALELAPEIPQLHLFAGQASFAAGQLIESKEFFVNAYTLGKNSPDARNYQQKLLALKSRLK